MILEIRKMDSGSRRWWIWQLTPGEWPPERTVRGFKTKTLASLFLRALEGDSEAAQQWYRRDIERNLKDSYTFPTASDAWKFAAQTAKQFGFSPDYVKADPNTFEPL